jgi:futalosine hydrolase
VPRLLIVTAVAAERAAVLGERASAAGELAGLTVHRCQTAAGLIDVVSTGVGAVAAALGTAALLGAAPRRYDLAISAGIAGGFAAVPIAGVVVADEVIAADLGAETADGGFSPLDALGMGEVRLPTDPAIAAELTARLSASCGPVLTVATVTGTAASAGRMLARYPSALAEAMEGFGVAQAAARAGTRFAEVRTISNRVGPRDRQAWQLGPALAALGASFEQLLAEPLHSIGERR